MKDKICMVTGGTSGIGEVTARVLAEKGASVIVVGRNPEKGAATISRIRQASGNPSVEFMRVDFSVQGQIREFAQAFQARYSRLDVLVNNAGAVFRKREVSADGLEMTFAVNHLGYFLLTNLLLDTLKASAPARIVNVSSGAHEGGKMNWDDLQLQNGYNIWAAYSQSKLANVLFTYELAKRLEGTGVTVNALHPGFVSTNLGANNGWIARLLMPLIMRFGISTEKGAQTSIYLASSPEVEGVTGQYFAKQKPKPTSDASHEAGAAARLWQISEQLTAL
ncbi:MAG: SDR family oxidoreductase [Ardenticatenaceae bacterium]